MSAANFFSGITKRLSFERCFLLIIILAIILRFAFLDLKLLHHDEAIHAWFAYELVTKGVYSYDPMYHGPLLYYLTAGMYWLFGQSDLIARFLPALFGTSWYRLFILFTGSGTLTRGRHLSPHYSLQFLLTWSISPGFSGMTYFSSSLLS